MSHILLWLLWDNLWDHIVAHLWDMSAALLLWDYEMLLVGQVGLGRFWRFRWGYCHLLWDILGLWDWRHRRWWGLLLLLMGRGSSLLLLIMVLIVVRRRWDYIEFGLGLCLGLLLLLWDFSLLFVAGFAKVIGIRSPLPRTSRLDAIHESTVEIDFPLQLLVQLNLLFLFFGFDFPFQIKPFPRVHKVVFYEKSGVDRIVQDQSGIILLTYHLVLVRQTRVVIMYHS